MLLPALLSVFQPALMSVSLPALLPVLDRTDRIIAELTTSRTAVSIDSSTAVSIATSTAVSISTSTIYPYLIREWDKIVRPSDRYSNETVTLRETVTKYKNMQTWMVEFLRKFENRGSVIYWVNSIIFTKFINLQLFTLILYGVRGSVVMLTSLN